MMITSSNSDEQHLQSSLTSPSKLSHFPSSPSFPSSICKPHLHLHAPHLPWWSVKHLAETPETIAPQALCTGRGSGELSGEGAEASSSLTRKEVETQCPVESPELLMTSSARGPRVIDEWRMWTEVRWRRGRQIQTTAARRTEDAVVKLCPPSALTSSCYQVDPRGLTEKLRTFLARLPSVWPED